ncbi:MAG: FUSC family protein, partial [Afipia sp.]|nr:FUSC family protein [Afipia sp.]
MTSIVTRTREFWTRRKPELRQTLRVTVATAVAFVAYKLFGFEQGYWAIFTVLIVMQGSIGGTL